MAYQARGSPARPSFDKLSSSVSTGFAHDDASSHAHDDFGTDETVSWLDGRGADFKVESLMNKLAIERRVQYGAEKMLDVSGVVFFEGSLCSRQGY